MRTTQKRVGVPTGKPVGVRPVKASANAIPPSVLATVTKLIDAGASLPAKAEVPAYAKKACLDLGKVYMGRADLDITDIKSLEIWHQKDGKARMIATTMGAMPVIDKAFLNNPTATLKGYPVGRPLDTLKFLTFGNTCYVVQDARAKYKDHIACITNSWMIVPARA